MTRAVAQYRKVAALTAPSRERDAARALLDADGATVTRRGLVLLVGATGLAAACGSPAVTPAAPTTVAPSAQSVLLITIDTLRADRVGAYGAAGARTGTLDGLARDGARFERAWATAPITLPSHASLLTGRYPPAHMGPATTASPSMRPCPRWPAASRPPASPPRPSSRPFRSTGGSASPPDSTSTTTICRAGPTAAP